ncbi:carboxypeptidase-like regulatory domain-containing protein [Roseimaritima ulvae]|uniref:Carboxypeptidase regulatory-like domain-containing protein n=1 Tax=Roseimaritima ulvae TaxID=980254 RepID=A0A5B9QNH1_9BACT|nr:carboxypeptidase-like regulatory domain-containing protein [Roseimaritima ulvae]QEG40657.1 hypothetical protein UC8_26740 [Roseimaritima ulvae]
MSPAAETPPLSPDDADSPIARAARWHSDLGISTSGRKKALWLGSCLLAVLVGGFAALFSLPARKPQTTLVALYLAPPDTQCIGVDAPHPPLRNSLLGLTVVNAKVAASPKTGAKDEKDEKDAVVDSKVLTDWRAAVAQSSRRKQLVLHVSSLARVDNGQVFFFGLQGPQRTEGLVSLTEVIEKLNRCSATSKLLVLEVQWPLISDHGDSSRRLSELDSAIKHQFRQFAGPGCHLLLASSGPAACRALPQTPITVLGHYLTSALQSGNADSDHNGRITMEELVNWSSPRIASDGLGGDAPQQIDWLAGSTPLQFMELPARAKPTERAYPKWLALAKQRRQTYIGDPRLPWDSEAVVRWGQLLYAIDAAWRRGENDTDLQRRLLQQEQAVVQVLDRALAERRAARADSLRLAALRIVPAADRPDDQLAAALLAKHAEILQNAPADKRDAQIAQAIKEYVAHYDAEDTVVAMAALLHLFDSKALNDLESLALVQKVNMACPRPLTYPVLDAVQRLLAMDAQPLRVQAVVQIFRLQGQLGTDPLANAILGDVVDNAMQQLIVAQRLVWNPGLTDKQQVRQQVEVAVNRASMALVAEQSLGHAIRQLQRIDAEISTDVLSGAAWRRSDHFQTLEHQTQKLVQSIERMRSTAQHAGILKSGELAMVRQASESLQHEWTHLLPSQNSEAPPAHDVRLVSRRTGHNDAQAIHSPNNKRLPPHPLQDSIDQLTSEAMPKYHAWCQAYLASSSQIEALPSYRRIAEMQLIAPNQNAFPVVVSGGLTGLSWEQPSCHIDLRYTVDLADAAPVQYKVLTPAADSLQVFPLQGSLPPGGKCTIQIQLDRDAAATQDTTLNGIWLCLRRGQDKQFLPLRMEPQPSAPAIDIEFGSHVTRDGCQTTLHLWPSTQPQWQTWNIRTRESTVPAVVATLSSAEGTTLESAPIKLSANGTAPIRFLPAKPVASFSGKPVAPALNGELTLELTDAAKGSSLGKWHITPHLKDPRKMLELGWAEYTVAENGKNRLEVSLARTPNTSAALSEQMYAPTVRLALDSQTISPLLDFASSQLQAHLPTDGQVVKLFAEDLRFREGGEPLVSIPLRIDGDPGYCMLQGRFPRRSGTVQLNWQRTPSLKLHAGAATTSTTPLRVQIAARNLVDAQALRLELFSDSNWEHPVWQTQLDQSRHADVGFRGGGKEHTVEIIAVRRDWQVTVPTHVGNGPHQMRVSTVLPVGVEKIVATHAFVIDDAEPQDIAARAVRSGQGTEVTVTMRPGISGVRSVSLAAVVPGKQQKPQWQQATSEGESDRRWSLRWPRGLAFPEKMQIKIETGAGKSSHSVCDVQVQTLKPVGLVEGTVLEGSLAQPGLTVEVAKPKGRSFARVQTDPSGKFQFALAPGRYVVKTNKPATGRQAEATITVPDQGHVHADLRLHP